MAERASDEWVEAANCLATVSHQLSSVFHEANNLLQVIAGSAEMIQMQSGLPESVSRRTTIISEHAHRVSALLGSLRELAKVAPRQPGERTDLGLALGAALDVRKHALTLGHVSLAIDVPEPAPVVRTGWRTSMQILLNLLLNAERAVRERPGPSIAVRLSREGGMVVLSVTDNGPGMPAAAVAPFTLDPQKDAAPLLGLGLSAVAWMAREEGGSFDLASGAHGTTVTVRLPGDGRAVGDEGGGPG